MTYSLDDLGAICFSVQLVWAWGKMGFFVNKISVSDVIKGKD